MSELPQKYDPADLEQRWAATWEASGIHRWDPTRPRGATFVVDTPPPTVSGSLHVGHVFSYTHQDLLVRFHRMRGFNISYPMGWDDNGLPTERRVQNVFKIKCNPALTYRPDWHPRRDKAKDEAPEEVSRRNFIEACGLITAEDEKAFETLWRRLGLSIDWHQQYATINAHARRVSQASFMDLVGRNQVYHISSPTMWDLDFQTAVAQAETEDRLRPGAFHDIRFDIEGGEQIIIATTRPELLAACVAVVAHPNDARYKKYFNRTAVSPLFAAPIPIMASPHADPEKGTGIMMVCTFGDHADVDFWKQSRLPLKQIIGPDGRLLAVRHGEGAFVSHDPERASRVYAELQGLTINQARKKIVEQLRAADALVGEPRALEHPVKFYERGERPIEFIPTRQWFIRLLEHRAALRDQGHKIQWHPSGMRTRYENWVEGLNQDWCISRQRFFGVPIPVWYQCLRGGGIDYQSPIYPTLDLLPIDPLSEAPPGYSESQRGKPGGFIGDPDVMDTWATSSMTPQIISHWPDNDEQHQKLFPMDIRPQSHEIIRTWAFYTIVKAWMHHDEIPWRHVTISGWILDPDRKKMSKSVGNVVTPDHLLEKYSSDAVRYWAARARLGVDTAYDEQVFRIGGRLCTKLFNASRFVLQQVTGGELSAGDVTEPLDLAYMAGLRGTVKEATQAFKAFDHAGALQAAEEAFWAFCDDYVELVKRRSYEGQGAQRRSAHATLRLALRTFLQLLAPTLPFITEEIWSWSFVGPGRLQSIHTSHWPTEEELDTPEPAEGEDLLAAAMEVLRKIRMAKTAGKRSLRWPVTSLEICGPDSELALLKHILSDVLVAGAVREDGVRLKPGPAPSKKERFTVNVTLGEEAAAPVS